MAPSQVLRGVTDPDKLAMAGCQRGEESARVCCVVGMDSIRSTELLSRCIFAEHFSVSAEQVILGLILILTGTDQLSLTYVPTSAHLSNDTRNNLPK